MNNQLRELTNKLSKLDNFITNNHSNPELLQFLIEERTKLEKEFNRLKKRSVFTETDTSLVRAIW